MRKTIYLGVLDVSANKATERFSVWRMLRKKDLVILFYSTACS